MATQPLVLATDYAGANLGAKIMAADADLGASPGIIVVPPGGSHTGMDQVVLSTDRTLLLGIGTYEFDATSSDYGCIIYNHRNTILGQGWGTVIKERNKTGQVAKAVFRDHGAWTGGIAPSDNDGVDDVRFADFQVLGNSPDFDSAVATLSIGNCHRVTAERIYMNATCTIGICAGGTSNTGNHATDIRIQDCQFLNVASQNIGFVNCRRFHCNRNTLIGAGQVGGPGASYIDVEPNISTDWGDSFEINDNVIDTRGAAGAGNGIIVQVGGGAVDCVRAGVVAGNSIFGSAFEDVTPDGTLSNGIFVSGAKSVTVAGNTVRRGSQCGIYVSSCTRCTIVGNTMDACGGGGVPAFEIDESTYCVIKANTLSFYNGGSNVPSQGNILKEGAGSDYNVFQANEIGTFSGTIGVIILTGAHSTQVDNTYDGRKAHCFALDGTIVDNTLAKRSSSVAGGVAQFTSSDVAGDVAGVCIGSNSGVGIAVVVIDPATPVQVKSDGGGTIAIGAAIEPSTTSDGRVKSGSTNKVGYNEGALVAASVDALCWTRVT